ncbi:hypothetical protein [Roseospirillum parvum]|uniref:Antifreeze glycopeptide polyprotein n=1 Tax=Roseospirillum parvum TaxID=83401 RepID=A0A1G8D5P3_9PROT|nr:hypothetical protein [Roseospirillum parvum]SDH53055.1 hypothetical protein SAMN05421742_107190 [Roseospirillum parvum]
MRGSPTAKLSFVLALGLSASLGLIAATPALAQSGGDQGPVPLLRLPMSPADEPAASPAPTKGAPQGIEEESLSGVGADARGVLDPGSGGLGADLWAGTTRPVAERLVALLPGRSSAAGLDLARSLLLSTARAPKNGPGHEGLLMAARVTALWRLGDAEAAVRLSEVVPGTQEGPLARPAVEARLAAGQTEAACRLAGAARRAEPFWQKLAAVCALAEGNEAPANLALAVLREQGEDDPAFFALAERLAGLSVPLPDSLPAPSLLHGVLYRLLEAPLPEDALGFAAPGWLLALAAENPGLEPERRLAVAERAVAAGALAPARLRTLYGMVELSPEERQMAPEAVPATSRGRAILVQRAGAETLPAPRAVLWEKALTAAAGSPAGDALAAALEPELAELTASIDLVWAAVPIAQGLYAAGRPDLGVTWFATASSWTRARDTARDAAARLLPYTRLAGQPSHWTPDALENWQTATAHAPETADHAAATLLALLASVGQMPTAGDRLLTLSAERQPAEVPSALVLGDLARAAAAGRRGETVALALIALGPEGGRAEPAVVATVIEALRKVGLEAAGRRLAIEAARAAGA